MNELERRFVADIQCELLLSKREKQRLSEKLDCLIILLKGAWVGESESINKISEIVGIPSPKIIPSSQEPTMSGETEREYLQITSSLLDEQLKEDATIKKSTKILRSSSAKRMGSAQRNTKRNQSSKRCTAIPTHVSSANGGSSQDDRSVAHVGRNATYQARPPPQPKPVPSTMSFGMANLSDILHMFSDADKMQKPVPLKDDNKIAYRLDGTESRLFDGKYDTHGLFSPGAAIGPRPGSAALQQRQDYIRSQAKKTARPQTAKPAFRHVTDSEFKTLIHSQHEGQSPTVSNPENTKESLSIFPVKCANKESPPSILVNLSAKGSARNKHASSTSNRMVFPPQRDDQALGDITDALQRVQEAERLFRLNTRRLQHRIGIPDGGCI